MTRIGQITGSQQVIQSNEITENTATANLGVGGVKDSFEQPQPVSSLREIAIAAKHEGKLPMTESNLNRVIAGNKPSQYKEAFKDVKGWIDKNFYLTAAQRIEVNSLQPSDISKIQDITARATNLNQPIGVRIFSNGFSSSPKQIRIVDANALAGHNLTNPNLAAKESGGDEIDKLQKELQKLKEEAADNSKWGKIVGFFDKINYEGQSDSNLENIKTKYPERKNYEDP